MKIKKQKKQYRAFLLSILNIISDIPVHRRLQFCFGGKKRRNKFIDYIGSQVLKNNRIISFDDVKALYKNPTKRGK